MAEHKKDDKKKDDKKSKPKHHSGGEMSFGMEIVLFLIALFVLWALIGKPSENKDKPLMKAANTSSATNTNR